MCRRKRLKRVAATYEQTRAAAAAAACVRMLRAVEWGGEVERRTEEELMKRAEGEEKVKVSLCCTVGR